MSRTPDKGYGRGEHNWRYLDGALPRRIVPSDVDGMIEYDGHFVLLEEKTPNETWGHGARMAFERAVLALGGLSIGLLVIDDGGNGTDIRAVFVYAPNHGGGRWIRHSTTDTAALLGRWAKSLEGGRRALRTSKRSDDPAFPGSR